MSEAAPHENALFGRSARSPRDAARSSFANTNANPTTGQEYFAKSFKVAANEIQSPATHAPNTMPVPASHPPTLMPVAESRSIVILSAAFEDRATRNQRRKRLVVARAAQKSTASNPGPSPMLAHATQHVASRAPALATDRDSRLCSSVRPWRLRVFFFSGFWLPGPRTRQTESRLSVIRLQASESADGLREPAWC